MIADTPQRRNNGLALQRVTAAFTELATAI